MAGGYAKVCLQRLEQASTEIIAAVVELEATQEESV